MCVYMHTHASSFLFSSSTMITQANQSQLNIKPRAFVVAKKLSSKSVPHVYIAIGVRWSKGQSRGRPRTPARPGRPRAPGRARPAFSLNAEASHTGLMRKTIDSGRFQIQTSVEIIKRPYNFLDLEYSGVSLIRRVLFAALL